MLLTVAFVATGCLSSSSDGSTGASGPPDVAALDASVPDMPATTLADTQTTDPPITSGRGYVATSTSLPGRAAPDVTAGDVSITSIRVFADPATGRYVTSANVSNTGGAFMNDLMLSIVIRDAGGATLDRIEAAIPALAAGETTAIVAVGENEHTASWTDVEIEHSSAAA